MLGAEKHTVEIDRRLPPPVFQREAFAQTADTDTRIVDQNVKPAEGGDGGGHHLRPSRFRGDVVFEEAGLAARIPDFLCDAGAAFPVDIADNDRRAFARQYFRARLADARCATRDDGDLARNPSHDAFSSGLIRPPP